VKLYNSLTRQCDEFAPRGDEVSLYVCGITPYDTTHLGHAFTYTVADVLVRFLESTGLKVRYVQNVTDIDDDILRKAKEVGKDWKEVGDEWTRYFIRDMKSLNVRAPDFFPRATDVIPEIIETVQKLLDSGVAYEADGSVYFDIHAWSDFGKLSQMSKEQMLPIANERGNHPDDPNKRDPLDFVLWQAKAPGEPAWESPWGMGRPGWHIECSTMCTRFLGETVDIHSGGEDLSFPHHECEIAQVEPVTGKKPFVRFWMHIAMVRYKGEKMSKSLGNLVMVRGLLERWSPDAVRFYLGGFHYRDGWSYEESGLERAAQQVDRMREALAVPGSNSEPLDATRAWQAFTQAMEDDLDTPAAERAILDLTQEIILAGRADKDVRGAQEALRRMTGVFGLRLEDKDPEARVVQGWNQHLKRFEMGRVED
jgi:L-cysteine:1D-myo-inositol 2-amino-2-deoxy-alpha-D-glucopyranoside ligase